MRTKPILRQTCQDTLLLKCFSLLNSDIFLVFTLRCNSYSVKYSRKRSTLIIFIFISCKGPKLNLLRNCSLTYIDDNSSESIKSKFLFDIKKISNSNYANRDA